MMRHCLLLLVLVSVSASLTCYKCAVFNMTTMSDEEKTKMSSALTLLGAPKCEETTEETTVQCESNQDQCHKIAVSSKLGGENLHSGYLVQCGVSSGLENLCSSYTFLAGTAGFPLESCTATGCNSDKCFNPNSGIAFNYNLYIIIASVATFLLSTL